MQRSMQDMIRVASAIHEGVERGENASNHHNKKGLTEMINAEQNNKVKLIMDLLSQVTSLKVVSNFLKKKELPYSVTGWDFLYQKRILPALYSLE